MTAPKVSVLTPVYNTQENYLRVCIESILNQTYKDFEFIILNDASTDPNVEKIVLSYDDPRIVYAVNEKNLGISPTRNKLIEMAKGEYLAIFDHDDISMPDRLERSVAYLDAHPDVGIVSSTVEVIGEKRGPRIWSVPEHDEEIQQKLLAESCVVHSACMIRKSVMIELGIRYEKRYSPAEDYALFCRFIGQTGFYNFQSPLIQYRNHETNTTHQKKELMRATTHVIRRFVRRDNPELWDVVRYTSPRKSRHRLFNLIPIIKVEEFAGRKVYYLFSRIPIWSITT